MSGDEHEGRKTKRRCASRNRFASAMPSAIHYVGYVEDDETPEMIMAKFAELERIKNAVQERQQAPVPANVEGSPADKSEDDASLEEGAAADPAAADAPTAQGTAGANPADGDLTDEQLLEVFKQTSMFNVKTALNNNQMLMGIDEILDYAAERYGTDEDVSDDDLRAFWSDDDGGGGGWDSDEEGNRRRGRRAGGGGISRGPRVPRNAAGIRARHNVVIAYNPDTQALVRRRVRAVPDRDEIVHIRIPPPPLPVSWARTVRPYIPRSLPGCQDMSDGVGKSFARLVVPSLPEALPSFTGKRPGDSVAKGGPFLAALINCGWERGGAPGTEAAAALARLNLSLLVPEGFVFIWVEKEQVQTVCKQVGGGRNNRALFFLDVIFIFLRHPFCWLVASTNTLACMILSVRVYHTRRSQPTFFFISLPFPCFSSFLTFFPSRWSSGASRI
jgi:hypothetical protein